MSYLARVKMRLWLLTAGDPRTRARKKTGAEARDETAENTEDELVAVQPKDAADPFDHAGRPKTIVISGEDHKIIGSQG